jgi:nucleoside-diphosphate-sugar epimerase
MRVLVLGGTGFIGPYVVRQLAQMGHEVTLFNRGQRQTEQPLPPKVARMSGDRDRLSEYAEEFRGLAPDVVLDMRPLAERDARVVVGTFKGIAKRLVAISSMDVYRIYGRLIGTEPGPVEEVPIMEESPLREKLYPYRGEEARADDAPDKWMDDYDKILVERVVMSEPELPGTVLRLPMVYGPGTMRDIEYVRRMADGREAILLDEGTAEWRAPRGYVEDVAYAIALAVTDGRAAGRVYNVGEQEALTVRDWVEQLGRAAEWRGRVVVLPAEKMPEHLRLEGDTAQQWVVDSSRIRRELGYTERVPREEALRRTVEWQRAHLPEAPDPAEYEAEDAVLREGE